MITKVNNDNANAYKSLFLKADAILGITEDDRRIASLDEYFQNITALTGTLSNNDLRYIVLPLDEPAFEINANTRTISVPQAFQNNGISVQGDEGAEVVFFKIDRYFDARDLGAPDMNIIIQWETAPDETGQAENGISGSVIRDIESEPGKVIFGWVLDTAITGLAGVIKFAVRFYRVNDDNEIDYNFSTLTATATIKPSLDLTLSQHTYSLTEAEQWIKDRLVDSPQTDATTEANKPVYVMNLLQYNVNDDDTLTELENGQKKLQVEITTGDAGVFDFVWNRWELKNDGTDPFAATPHVLSGVKTYFVTADLAFADGSTYYVKKTVNGTTYYDPIATSTYPSTKLIADYVTAQRNAGNMITAQSIYQCYGECTVNQTGYYKVTTVNRVGKSKNSEVSNTVLVPGPTTIKPFNIQPSSEGTKDKNPATGVAHVFLVDQVDDAEHGKFTAKVTPVHDENNATVYSWQIENAESGALPLSTTNVYSDEVATADRANYNKKFIVTVVDSRNGDSTAPKTITYRVTDPAHELLPTEVYDTKLDGSKVYTQERGIGQELEVELAMTGALSDELTYQWYKYTKDTEDDDLLIPEQTSASYTPSAAGAYYCRVTNHIKDNGVDVDSITFDTPRFVVTD